MLLTPRQLGARLSVCLRTLAGWRVAGRGPGYIKLGDTPRSRVRYPITEVEAFEKRLQTNTGENR